MPLIYWFSRRMTLWGSISFNLAVFINIIIAFFYPYVEGASTGEPACLPAAAQWGDTPHPRHPVGSLLWRGKCRSMHSFGLLGERGVCVYMQMCLQQLAGCSRCIGSSRKAAGRGGCWDSWGQEGWAPCSRLPLLPGVLGSPLISLLFWILICFSIAALFTKRYSVRPLIVALILRSIYYLGIGPTLNILGALNVSAEVVRPPCSPAGPSPPLVPARPRPEDGLSCTSATAEAAGTQTGSGRLRLVP